MTKKPLLFFKDNGFTLIEIIMTILILGLSSLILIPYFGAIVSSPDPVLRERAISLGQSMMDEILAKKWDNVSPPTGGPIRTNESPSGSRGLNMSDPSASAVLLWEGADGEAAGDRSNWDDVDDFNTHTETDNFLDQNNNAFALTGYTRTVQVHYILSSEATINQSTSFVAGPTDTKRIIVTVTAPNNETFTLVSVVCNF